MFLFKKTAIWDSGRPLIEFGQAQGCSFSGKMASGIADDAVTSTYLALQCPAFVAPAMNPNMYSHSAVQRNLKVLQDDGVTILDPAAGEVICGDVGQGKMEEIQKIEAKLLEKYNEVIS
mgnify:CR=1 FL=1